MKYKIAEKNVLGNRFNKDESYQIIGAGISGLLLGYQMKKRGISFIIKEKTHLPGGLIKTHYLEGLGLAEQAANGFVWCDELAEISETIGLTIQQPDATSKARYLVRNNELSKFPLGIFETIGMLGKLILPHSKRMETVEDFGLTFFGKSFTNQILEPAFSGIYGAPISRLSFQGVLKPFAEQLNHTNHLPRAIYKWRKEAKKDTPTRKKLSGTQSFTGGFGKFPLRLAEYLKEHIEYNCKDIDINGPTILTAPAHISSQYFDGEISNLLNSFNYTPMISTTMFFKKQDVNRFKPGFGCLIPRSEGRNILGVLFNSSIFPDRVDDSEYLSFTCMMRDYEGSIINKNEDDIVHSEIMPDLEGLLGVEGKPLGYKMFKWKKGIPIYDEQLVSSWGRMDELLKKEYPSVRLLGNYTGQISVRGMAQFIPRSFD